MRWIRHGRVAGIDRSETLAIKKLFGEQAYPIPITANKSMTGHLLGVSSAVEAIALVKTIQQNTNPPTINHEQKDPVCDLDYVLYQAREASLYIGLSNFFGFGGHNAVIVVNAYDHRYIQ